MYHSKLWRTGKIMQELAQQPETTHKPLSFANLGRIDSAVARPILWPRMQALMERLGDCALAVTVNWKLM